MIAKRFVDARLRAGFELVADAAAALDIPVMQLYRYERGTSEPRLKVLRKMRRVYNVSIDELVGWSEP